MKGVKLSIVFVVPGMDFSGGSLTRHSLGGSETAAIKLSEELANRGHDVTVFSNCSNAATGGPGIYNGVTYQPINNALTFIQNCEHDVLVVQRNSSILETPNKAKVTILWNHDIAVKPLRARIHKALWNLNFITGLSEFHIEQQYKTLNIPKEVMWQTRNGITLADFKNTAAPKNPKKLMYAARPERGLENLVGVNGIMEQVYKIDPEIHLYVAGYDHTVPEMRAYYEALWGRIEQLPNCTNLGCLPKHMLYKQYEDTAIYVYPTAFEEISCISAMECMRSGVVMLTTRLGALPETLGDAGIFIDGAAHTSEYRNQFVSQLFRLINDSSYRQLFEKVGYERSEQMDWTSVAKEWEEKVFSYFVEQTIDNNRLYKHFAFHNDIVMCSKIKDTIVAEASTQDYETYFKTGKPDLQSIEAVTRYRNDTKFNYAKNMIYNLLTREQPIKTVVDYGCDIGQYTFALAQAFPQIQFIGIDVANSKITALQKLVSESPDVKNVTFDVAANYIKAKATCDCAICFDVVHLKQRPEVVIDEVEGLVRVGGVVLISTPTGAWSDLAGDLGEEYTGYSLLHWLWNLERADLSDLVGEKTNNTISVGYAGKTKSGSLIGWHFVSYFVSPGCPTGKINIDRKLLVQTPRQTVTLSMIVKDCENTLHRALKSVRDIVDDIVVVDTGSTDSTIEIAKQYTDKVFSGPNPLEVGFAEARNETLKYIDTDWIVWIDSDETLMLPTNIRKYFRPNVYSGYAIRQHHFSVQPVNCFKPDLPVRVWRTNLGIKWFGIIHEHVETGLNQSVQPATLLGDVEIAHDGYLTEEIRRGRFNRNIKLLLRDRKENPERRLGKFLMMRDQIHMARYELEANGGRATAKQIAMCEEVIKAYRKDFLGIADHMQIDGMSYYSEALRMLNRGFEITWNICAAKQGPKMDTQGTKTARIENKEDYITLITAQVNGMCEPYEGKYA